MRRRAVGQRLGNAPESRADVAREVGNLMEVEHPRVPVDARNRDGLACGHGSAHKGRRVPFIVKGERHQYALRREKIGARQEACNDGDGSGRPDLRGQRIAFGQHTRSQGGFRLPQRGALWANGVVTTGRRTHGSDGNASRPIRCRMAPTAGPGEDL